MISAVLDDRGGRDRENMEQQIKRIFAGRRKEKAKNVYLLARSCAHGIHPSEKCDYKWDCERVRRVPQLAWHLAWHITARPRPPPAPRSNVAVDKPIKNPLLNALSLLSLPGLTASARRGANCIERVGGLKREEICMGIVLSSNTQIALEVNVKWKLLHVSTYVRCTILTIVVHRWKLEVHWFITLIFGHNVTLKRCSDEMGISLPGTNSRS